LATYKLGVDFLASVIWEEGETWIDLWNDKEYE